MTTQTIDQTIFQKLEMLTVRVEQLERELFTLKTAPRTNGSHDPVVATQVEDGITFTVTQSEADAMRDSLKKKSYQRPDEVIHSMVLIKKIAPYRQEKYSDEEQKVQFFETIADIRAKAVANGTSINEEWEAVIDE